MVRCVVMSQLCGPMSQRHFRRVLGESGINQGQPDKYHATKQVRRRQKAVFLTHKHSVYIETVASGGERSGI